MNRNHEAVLNAAKNGTTIPAFNIPYLPMMEPIVKAVVDEDVFAFIAVARLEFYKFEAVSQEAIRDEFERVKNDRHVGLHLDHTPVIDEDGVHIDSLKETQHAISLGFGSVMVDGSRLSLAENIAETAKVASAAHKKGVPCEAELGAVLGHEAGPLPPYEELFASGKGFTDIDEAARFVKESGCDWLSVAIGNIHGAISAAARDQKKVAARLNLDHLSMLREATGIPLVLHGGSGIQQEFVIESFKRGIAKINIGTEVRQAYEAGLREGGIMGGKAATYKRTRELMRDYYRLSGNRALVEG